MKKRIVWIMAERVARRLDVGRKLLLTGVGVVVLGVPVVFGVANAPQNPPSSRGEDAIGAVPRFEAVSVKRFESDAIGRRNGFSIMDPPYDGSFYATGVTLQDLMREAYGVQYSWLILRAPSWLNSDNFDIQANADNAANDQLRALSRDQEVLVKRRMLQALLSDRFKLTIHRETKELPVYALVVAKNGPKLQESKPGEACSNGDKGSGAPARPGTFGMEFAPGGPQRLTGCGISIKELTQVLMDSLHRPVLDLTGLKGSHDISILVRLLMDLRVVHRPDVEQNGLKGSYDFSLHWRPYQSQPAVTSGLQNGNPGSDNAPRPGPSEPSIFTALEEQLGLRLVSVRGPVEVLVIDHVERPSQD